MQGNKWNLDDYLRCVTNLPEGLTATSGCTDPDNQTFYTNPRAWRNAKRAMGVDPADPSSGGPNGRAMLALDEYCRRCRVDVRYAFAAAIRMYLAISPEARKVAMAEMYRADEADLDADAPARDVRWKAKRAAAAAKRAARKEAANGNGR